MTAEAMGPVGRKSSSFSKWLRRLLGKLLLVSDCKAMNEASARIKAACESIEACGKKIKESG